MKLRESQLLKNQKALTGTKRDGRKKFIKSTTPQSDLKRPVVRKQQGGIFTTYNSISPYEGPTFELPSIAIEPESLPINKLEANRRKVVEQIEKLESSPEVTEEPSKEPLPVSKETEETKETSVKLPETVIKTKEDFVKTMTPAFENALKSKGLDTKYAKYLVAQSALESNWGKSQSGKFNFGGIKGKGTTRKTREVINGRDVYINDSFRDFKDINDYANYHVSLLNNKRYQAFNGDFIDSVVRGGYATDPNYKNALTNVYNQIAKGQKGLIVQAVNKVKSILPKEEPKEPVNTVGIIKEYGPSFATSFLSGNINPFVSKLFEGAEKSQLKTFPKTDWNSLSSKYRRPIDVESMEYIENWANSNLPEHQRDALLGTILEESGGNPEALSPDNNFYGLLQWENRRYPISNDTTLSKKDKLNKQLEYIKGTLTNYSDFSSWTDGGRGSGYQSKKDAINRFNNSSLPLDSTVHALNFGYVRPAGKHDSVKNRLEASKLIQANRR